MWSASYVHVPPSCPALCALNWHSTVSALLILQSAVGASQCADFTAALALGIAGKLIVQLGLGGAEWEGLTAILRDELRENEDTSNEQRVIRASLAGLRGSEREKTGVRQLFKLFALVPEDTVAPLQTLQLMYMAVYDTATTSLLHIRKWLKVLVDRSRE